MVGAYRASTCNASLLVRPMNILCSTGPAGMPCTPCTCCILAPFLDIFGCARHSPNKFGSALACPKICLEIFGCARQYEQALLHSLARKLAAARHNPSKLGFCSRLAQTLDFILRFLAMAMTEQAHHYSSGLTKWLDFILRFLAMAMTEQAHHCSSGLTKTFTCVQLSNTYLSATLTTATFPTAAACRGFDAGACTPTPRDLLSSHWQLRLHFIWKGSQPFIYRCAPRGTRTVTCPLYL